MQERKIKNQSETRARDASGKPFCGLFAITPWHEERQPDPGASLRGHTQIINASPLEVLKKTK